MGGSGRPASVAIRESGVLCVVFEVGFQLQKQRFF